ncbi:MAG: VOC family protein [Chloroflexota bacterium]|nr:VOC family protein [Chloroflexota bacterium]
MTTATGMGLRLELFVRDLDASLAFYCRVLGFELVRREPGYASVRCGGVTFGLGPISRLPPKDGYFTQARLEEDRGAGVEIVLEVNDVTAYHERVTGFGYPILHELQRRPWGLTDFRIADPDGYYLRITSKE